MVIGQFTTKLITHIAESLLWALAGTVVSAMCTASAVVIEPWSSDAVAGALAVVGAVIGGLALGTVFVMSTTIYERTVELVAREGPQTAVFFAKIFGGNSLPTLAVGVLTAAVGLSWSLSSLAVVLAAATMFLVWRIRTLIRRAAE